MKTLRVLNLMICVGLLLVGATFAINAIDTGHTWLALLGGLPLLGVVRASHLVKDATLTETEALPASAGNTETDGFDLGVLTPRGARLADTEMQISAPALTTTELPDAATATYSLETAADSVFTSAKIIADKVIVQTGAGGAGAAAAAARMKIPSDCEQYIRCKVTTANTPGNCSAKSLTFELLF